MSISVSGSLVGASAPFGVVDTDGTTLPSDTTPSYPEPIEGYTSTDTIGWKTELDGTNDHWLRGDQDYGATTNASIECTWIGGGLGLDYLVTRHNNDRFYLAVTATSVVMFGNGGLASQSQTSYDPTKINHAKLTADGVNVKFYLNGTLITTQAQAWTGTLNSIGFGVNGGGFVDHLRGTLLTARVVTDTEDDTYIIDTDLDYTLKQGTSQLWTTGVKTIGGAATVPSADSITINEAGSTLAGVYVPVTSGDYVTVSGVLDLTSGQVDISAKTDFSGVITTLTSSGAFSFTMTALGAVAFKRSFASGAVCTITDLAVVPDTALTLTNAVTDGSNRERITRKADNSGWVGVSGDYEYADGAIPVDSYGTEYSTAYS